ncbi:MAG: serine/threonine-protein kinase PknK, partial [Planctomycetes bacterium]|nr:serine/threonine-protein kinase PknK [Planctomycetota bacterium]
MRDGPEEPVAAPAQGRLAGSPTLRSVAPQALPSTRSPEGSLIAGRYRVLGLLGEGGMGSVYEVTDLSADGRPLALKTLPMGPEARRMAAFLRHEFRALSELRHPNVIRVHDFGTLGPDAAYFTMDLVRGKDFLGALREESWPTISALAAQVCRGLEYIHARGYVHRDLKPANVLVERDGAGEGAEAFRVTIMDFGIAGGGTDSLPAFRGTPQYMAPEVFRGGPVDARTDLYALGVMLYETLAGRLPFEEDSARELARAHMERAPEPPSVLGVDLPEGLEAVLSRLLAKDPAERHRTANEVILDLNDRLGTAFALETRETRLGWIRGGPLRGRADVLHALVEDLRAAFAGEGGPRVLLIEGEPGMGKTRLVAELRREVQLGGRTWCEGRAALVPALRQIVAALGGATRTCDAPEFRPVLVSGGRLGRADSPRGALDHYGRELTRLLPELEPRYGRPEPGEGGPRDERLRLRDALASFVLAASREGPLALCLEDLHEGDETALELVEDLARRLAL